MFKNTFSGGIHPLDYKSLSEKAVVEKAPLPKSVLISLSQHLGKLPEAIVKVGDLVKTGQKIAEASGKISLNMHSSISGKVKSIENVLHPKGENILGIEIESDGKDEWVELVDDESFMELSIEEMRNRVFEAGICGMGGAGFPTAVKLEPPNDKPIDIVIVSGVECEPFLTADDRLMIERGEDILHGLKISLKVLSAKKGIIAIESNKPKAIKTMKKIVKNEKNIRVVVLECKYPQGGEKQLIYAATKRKVPLRSLPSSVGVIVNNVATIVSIYEAVRYKKPLIEKIITISGKIVKRPANLLVRIGAKVSELIEYCGGTIEPITKAIIGGPMMGYTISSLDVPVIKTTSGVLLLHESEIISEEEQNCIRCGRCIDVCPCGLMPSFIASAVKYCDLKEAEKAGVVDCLKCGSCAYVCPAHIKFMQWVEIGKLRIKN